MKFPLDLETMKETVQSIAAHDQAQRELIEKLTELLQEAMREMGAEDTDWYQEAAELFQGSESTRIENENRKFHENTMRVAAEMERPKSRRIIPTQVSQSTIPESKAKIMLNTGNFGELEESFGGQMDEDELAKYFKERPMKKIRPPDFSKMSLLEIEEWERRQDNSNDIYKVAARVKNLARGGSLHLTPQGEALCNSFVHVVKSLYDFAEKVPDRETRVRLQELIRSHESFPATFIAAAMAGVKPPK